MLDMLEIYRCGWSMFPPTYRIFLQPIMANFSFNKTSRSFFFFLKKKKKNKQTNKTKNKQKNKTKKNKKKTYKTLDKW